jgi:glycogen(starch) synthase
MYPPHHFGGYELVWQSAMRALRAAGHEVRIVTTDFRTATEEPDEPDVYRDLRWYLRNNAFPKLSIGERVTLERHNARVLEAHLAGFRPDVVAWWAMGGMSLSLIERVRRRRVAAVAFVHDDWLSYGPDVDGWIRPFRGRWRPLRRPVEQVLRVPTHVELDRAARYVFVSEAMRARALEGGRDLASTGIAHSGIDASFISPGPQNGWAWRLLYVGRLDVRKGVHTAIEALDHLPEEATLTIVGAWDDAEERRLRELAVRVGVAARVDFRGQAGRAELPAVYRESDAVLFPVIWEEPWGLVPLEAMAQGRPVVATGRGGSGEYLRDGENCLLFDAEDAGALAAAVRRLAAEPSLRARLREGGLEAASQHTEQHFNEAVVREVEAAADGAAPDPS